MRLFHKKQDGFNLPYSFEKDTPLMWWSTNYTGFNSIGKLAIKLFSITPILLIVKEPSHHWVSYIENGETTFFTSNSGHGPNSVFLHCKSKKRTSVFW